MAVLVDLQQVAVRRVDRVLFEDLSLTVSDGDRIGVVGINGTGKSTLLRIVAGVDAPEEGQVRRGRGTRVGFLDQVPDAAARHRARRGRGRVGGRGGPRPPGHGYVGRRRCRVRSPGGQAKRVALARVLAHPAELLVLDEPTNHLDLGAVAWLEQRLLSFRGGLVLVTHDRHLLDRLTTRMLETRPGTGLHARGWLRVVPRRPKPNAKSRRPRPSRPGATWPGGSWPGSAGAPRPGRASRRPGSTPHVRLIEGAPAPPARSAELEVAGGHAAAGRQGDRVHRGRLPLRRRAAWCCPGSTSCSDRRERLGIVGANGIGQVDPGRPPGRPATTHGRARSRSGRRWWWATTTSRVSSSTSGPGCRTWWPARTGRPASLADVELMKRFSFTGELPFARVGTLSGGERRRLQLLLVIAGRPNVLFLDEPTNDLDLDTLRILEDFLEDWPGALVVVSHDRTFLERTTDRLVAVETDGTVAAVPGGVAGWVARVEQGDARRAGALPSRSPTGPSARDSAPGTGAGPPIGRLLREAEKDMVRRQRQRDRITEALSGAVGHVEMTRLGDELAAAQAALDEAEEHWLALAEEAESGP